MSHVTEAIDSLVGIGIQLGKRSLNLRKGGSLLNRVGHNGLNGSHFELILIKAIFDGSDKAGDHTSTRV